MFVPSSGYSSVQSRSDRNLDYNGTVISWKWSKAMRDLYDAGFHEFIDKFLDGRHTSLLVLGITPTGDRRLVTVTASDDAEMFRLAKARIEELDFVRFIALGEGRAPISDRGLEDVFIMYFQDTSDTTVQSAIMPYRREGEAIRFAQWYRCNLVDGAWTSPRHHTSPSHGIRDRLKGLFNR